MPQLLKPVRLEPVLRNKRSHRNEKPTHHNKEGLLFVVVRGLLIAVASLVAEHRL